MKATIEIPEDLYRRVKAKSALLGCTIREVTVELLQTWLAVEPVDSPTSSPEHWLEEWIRLGEDTLREASSGLSATGILVEDRNRLEQH